ncbi:peptidoglycan-binding protein [Streptomyces sp. enrichment culture]|uniref:peptidoglycan-binding protein n=1 Tax=Streptomyces sp. enrichment culture TaxID=1795815 RepID=UPI003F57AC2E
MSRWKELPAELDPQVRQLVVRLRRLKDRSGLSTRQLAVKTGYSARSWHRYLNGLSLPPGRAVEAMARVCGDDPVRLLVLHEVGAEHWAEGRPATDAPDTTPATPARQPFGRFRRTLITVGTAALVLSVSTSVLLAIRLGEARAELADRRAAAAAAPVTVSESMVPVVYTCRPEERDGRWYAGLSRTTGAVLAYTYVGPEVAEAQCLLRRAGFPPGDIDGVFGPKTQRAVQRIQERDGLVVDGVVGPHTWKALREGPQG